MYSITVTLGTLGDSTLTLYDTSGTITLEFNDDYTVTFASQIVWAAHTTGTYYVAVAGYLSETGGYSLNVSIWSGPVPTLDAAIEYANVLTAVSAMMVDNSVVSALFALLIPSTRRRSTALAAPSAPTI